MPRRGGKMATATPESAWTAWCAAPASVLAPVHAVDGASSRMLNTVPLMPCCGVEQGVGDLRVQHAVQHHLCDLVLVHLLGRSEAPLATSLRAVLGTGLTGHWNDWLRPTAGVHEDKQ